PIAQARHFLVFQEGDCADERIVIDGEAARSMEGVLLGAAEAAKRPDRLSSDRRNEWTPTALAHGILYREERAQARLADGNPAGLQERRAADAARRRENDRRKR